MSHLRLPAKPHDSTHVIAPLPRARSNPPSPGRYERRPKGQPQACGRPSRRRRRRIDLGRDAAASAHPLNRPARSREPADKALLQKDAPAIPAASYTANVLRAGSWPPYAAANRDIATGIRAARTILVSIAILALLRMRRSENKKHQSEPA